MAVGKRYVWAVLVVLALGGCPEPSDPNEHGDPRVRNLEQQALNLINAERTRNGIAALAATERLEAIARAHSAALAEMGALAHTGPDGRDAAQRLADARIPFTEAGENLARIHGGDDPARMAVDAWAASPGHRANLLDDAYARSGVGVAIDESAEPTRYYFTHVLIDNGKATTSSTVYIPAADPIDLAP